MEAIARYFKFAERGTNLATEVRAGVTTFAVMAYIIFLNPLILGVTTEDGTLVGPDPVAVGAATALLAGVLTIAMGIVANVPIALAAGLGINGVVAFNLILGRGLSWQGAMGVILLEGIVITILVLVGLREAIMDAVPASLKRAIAVGIGLFLLFIGAVDAGLIASTGIPVPPVAFAGSSPAFPLELKHVVVFVGLFVTIALYVMKVRAALLISIVVTTVVALALGVKAFPTSFGSAADFSTLGQANPFEVFETLGVITAVLVIFSIMLSDFFDTMGTVTAVSEEAGIMTEDGKVPNLSRVLLVDSVAAAAGGFAGTSSNTSYIESAAGVGEGGKTGFTSVVTGLLFLVGIIAAPLVLLVPFEASGPVLILVGFLLFTQINEIDFRDAEEGIPALLTLIFMPLSYDITTGIGAGFVSWVFIKVVRGKLGAIHPLMWIVAVAFVIFFLRGWLETFLPAV